MLEIHLEYGQSISPFYFSRHKSEKPQYSLFSTVELRLDNLLISTNVPEPITQGRKSTGRRNSTSKGVLEIILLLLPAIGPGWALWTQITVLFIYCIVDYYYVSHLLHSVTSFYSCSMHLLPINLNLRLLSWSPDTAKSYHQFSLSKSRIYSVLISWGWL